MILTVRWGIISLAGAAQHRAEQHSRCFFEITVPNPVVLALSAVVTGDRTSAPASFPRTRASISKIHASI